MEGRSRRPPSPERPRPGAAEARKVPVVYYLSRSCHLEHPHFIEVPLSSPEGLYLRDVINRLNMVRGKGMTAMYSWSCKRSYKNGFVWHDLADDDLIIPAAGGEYVLKGSELLEQSPSVVDRVHHSNGIQKQQSTRFLPQKEVPKLSRPREASCSSPPPPVAVIREAKPHPSLSLRFSQEEEDGSSDSISPESGHWRSHLPGTGSPNHAEFMVYKPTGSVDAATQTEDVRRRPTRQSPEGNGSVACELAASRQGHPRRSAEWQGAAMGVKSMCPTLSNEPLFRGKSESLESLIRADAIRTDSSRVLEEDDIVVPTCPRARPTNVLMQLITCGSISAKDCGDLGLVGTYRPRFPSLKLPSPVISRSMMMRELDYLSDDQRLMGLRLEDKEYFSGSIIETKMHREVAGKKMPILKRSSSYSAERNGELPDSVRPEDDDTGDRSRSRCLPRTAIFTSILHPKAEMLKSPVSDCRRSSSTRPDCSPASGEGSRRFTDASSSLQGSSVRLDSFRKEQEKLVRIEES